MCLLLPPLNNVHVKLRADSGPSTISTGLKSSCSRPRTSFVRRRLNSRVRELELLLATKRSKRTRCRAVLAPQYSINFQLDRLRHHRVLGAMIVPRMCLMPILSIMDGEKDPGYKRKAENVVDVLAETPNVDLGEIKVRLGDANAAAGGRALLGKSEKDAYLVDQLDGGVIGLLVKTPWHSEWYKSISIRRGGRVRRRRPWSSSARPTRSVFGRAT
ncbi:Aste57867_24726 [Aphanomyces stellatus]|uniref:Aste57867_24726 protein n=1 Tax=Aphanomyces stellatus TaxID=120398 RepID=A0A485LRA6_9STRA|nr:hypothetical protein As57867_024648 [Aphanomyces stellatus]VFU01363.1 Aste57867_24726 [Aphanomyces stellatus]